MSFATAAKAYTGSTVINRGIFANVFGGYRQWNFGRDCKCGRYPITRRHEYWGKRSSLAPVLPLLLR